MFWLIFCINILIYLASFFSVFSSSIYSLALSANSSLFSLLGHAFVHTSFNHLAFNCASFFMITRLLGRVSIYEWFGVYFLGAIFSAVGFLALNPHSVLIGASGAISALFGYAAIKLRQISLLGVFLLLNIISAVLLQGQNIAYSAHICGLLYGALFAMVARYRINR